MAYVALHGMPLHELLRRGKAQELWPIPEYLMGEPTEYIVRAMADTTGHAEKYIRAVLKAGATLDPANWPSLYTKGERVKVDLQAMGRAKFTNKPNPVKREGIDKSNKLRALTISHNSKVRVVCNAAPIRTNATQLERVKAHAPVLTNGRMRKNSKSTTAYSTGFAPPSRKDETRVRDNPKPLKRFRKD